MARVFVSYSHQQGDWVWDRLVPVLEAGGAGVLIDRERFKAGRSVVGQMDAVQDRAQRHLLVLSQDYLASDYCRHELDRAVAVDPDFTRGAVVPVMCHAYDLPAGLSSAVPLTGPDPLWLDLQEDSPPAPWAGLLAACNAELGFDAPHWLSVRDKLVRFLERGQSVNLVVNGSARWDTLLAHLQDEHFPQLALVDLEQGVTVRRRGLILEILQRLGHRPSLPDEPDDLAELDRLISAAPPARVALTHFDLVANRPQYGVDLFAALRYLIMTTRKLTLLVQSRTPFAGLLPRDHPLSEIDIKTIELQGTP